MLRLHRRAPRCLLIAIALGSLSGSVGRAEGPPAAPGPVAPAPPIFLFLNAPADLDALVQRLKEPDFVLLRGADAGARPVQGGAAPRPAEAGRAGIESLAARGEVVGDLAHLTIELGVVLDGPGRAWVPIRLDDLNVVDPREGDRELLPRIEGGGWQVEVEGAGRHRVLVDVAVPVRPTADGRRIELAIPWAASTQVQLVVGPGVTDAVVGTKERVAIEPTEGGQQTRLAAHLPPRDRLELSWRFAAGPGLRLPPLLEALGEIAVDVDPEALHARSSWVVTSARGTAGELEWRLDPTDEVIELKLDDQPLPTDVRRTEETASLIVPLTEPLRPGSSRRLLLVTRRPLEAVAARRAFRGFPLRHAASQSGAIAIATATGGGLWVDGSPGPALRQIDLRQLPTDLKARPANVLAYQFVDQPFELGLCVEPSPPRMRVAARSTLAVDAGQSRLDTWLDYEVTRGRVFEVVIGLPRGLDLEAVGPESVVGSYQWVPEAAGPSPPDLTEVPRVLTARLTPQARDAGTFRLHLVGRQGFDPSQPLAAGLFQPRGAGPGGGRIAVLSARNVAVDLPDEVRSRGDGAGFGPAGLEPPADWPWPAEPADAAAPALWLRYDATPAALPLRVALQPRTVHHDTTVTARIDRRRLDVQQETTCHVHYGSLTRVDVAVPPALDGLWDVDSGPVAGREPLRIEPDGQHRYRLTLSREVTDTLRLRFRYRLPLEPGLAPDKPRTVEIPWLTVLEGSASGPVIRVAADPGIGLAPEGRGWVRPAGDEAPTAPPEGGPPIRFTLVRSGPGADPPRVVATARALVPLPSLLASRLWLRTIQGPDGGLRTSAWYRIEAHEGAVSVAVPAGAELVRAWVDYDPVAEIEQVRAAGFRVRFPPGTSAGPVLVRFDYAIPATVAARSAWEAPQLEGGLVQQVLWEVRIPWNHAVAGVPSGWTDENRWYWGDYVWKRRPTMDTAALATWIAGPNARARVADGADDIGRGSSHSYLFGRQGSPPPLRVAVVSRALLLGACSGAALVLGLLVLRLRPGGLIVGGAVLALAFAVALAQEPSLTLVVAQSSVVGVALTAAAAFAQHRLDRRRPRGHYREAHRLAPASGVGSSLLAATAAGSDDSTALRLRPGSTVDHVRPTLPDGPDVAVVVRPGIEDAP